MARTTAGKLAGRTASAAKKVTASVARAATGRSAPAAADGTPTAGAEARARKAAAAGATAGKTASKAPVKKAPAEKAPVKKAPVKKAPAEKAPAEKAAPAKAAATKAPKKAPAKKAPAKKAPAKKTPARRSPAREAAAPTLAVKPDEEAWTSAELDEVRAGLTADVDRLREELELVERELDGLMRDAGDGAGNDQADVGSATFERDHEMSLANNARTMLEQTTHALRRIDDGTYGSCERCGQPIGKNRLMAFPRATLCVPCKQREERR